MKTLSLLACLFLAGCVGTPFKWDTARQIKVGMTKAQVEQIMGKPGGISTGTGDQEFWSWNYGTALGKGGFFQIVLKDGKVVEVPKISPNL